MKNIHWTAIGAAAITTLGVVSSPAVLGMLPPKYAAIVAGLGIIAQAFTKPVPKASVQSSGYLMGSGRDGTA